MSEFIPSLPDGDRLDKNVNVSHKSPLKEFAILAGGLLGIILLTFFILGFFVDIAIQKIPQTAESKYFPNMTQFWVGKDSTKDSIPKDSLQRALQNRIDLLIPCMKIDIPIRAHLHLDQTMNAFALPGGDIVVFKGLLDKVVSQSGVDFVLAHELAHFQNRDHLRGMGRALLITLGLSMIFGADSRLAEMAGMMTNFEQARYSRTRESAADKSALKALYCLQGHTEGATELFEVIEKQQHLPKVIHYFSTHPDTKKRIQDLEQWSKELKPSMNIKQ